MKRLGRTTGDIVGQALFNIILGLAVVLCLAPAIIVLVYSFFTDVFINFPPEKPGLALYYELFTKARWRDAMWVSLQLCVPTAILTLVLVVPAAVALERARIRFRDAIEFMALLPLLLPSTAYAVGIYIIYLKLDLAGSFPGLLFAEAVVATPTAFLIVRAAIRRLPHNLDLVAMSLGATRLRALFDVTVRLLVPSILVAGLFAFVHAFNDATFVVFLAGPGLTTVSKTIFDALAYAIDPAVAALSGAMMVFVIVLTAIAQVARRRGAN